ncbi:unnamed protein product [Camellia sinensis]
MWWCARRRYARLRCALRRCWWSQAVVIMKEFEEKCGTPLLKLRQIADAMTVDMHAGLASEGGSKLKMIISYVHNLPTGYGFMFI